MTVISEYMGDGEYANRKASIRKDGDKTYVVKIQDNEVVEECDVSNHSIYYAEDAAENWVMGVNS
jgi:hypothetical protein